MTVSQRSRNVSDVYHYGSQHFGTTQAADALEDPNSPRMKTRSARPGCQGSMGSAAFKIAGAPHMTPYMVSTAPSFLLMARASHRLRNAVSLGNMVTRPHC